ncbi:hypothetical protein HELRODRAFT_178708 [Helobdella robusta]|uniref:Uncharacterized protein n=1 Tax=Helobdella robusta TaxID=6412 RepID=T1FDL8_HELRO|nr:hypothetical protein HELRODRAFT_178708 [Helobdella robusta]ESN96908.1 hypothetical protein HELRODRAFT_178708 [Helobdella robusta]
MAKLDGKSLQRIANAFSRLRPFVCVCVFPSSALALQLLFRFDPLSTQSTSIFVRETDSRLLASERHVMTGSKSPEWHSYTVFTVSTVAQSPQLHSFRSFHSFHSCTVFSPYTVQLGVYGFCGPRMETIVSELFNDAADVVAADADDDEECDDYYMQISFYAPEHQHTFLLCPASNFFFIYHCQLFKIS